MIPFLLFLIGNCIDPKLWMRALMGQRNQDMPTDGHCERMERDHQEFESATGAPLPRSASEGRSTAQVSSTASAPPSASLGSALAAEVKWDLLPTQSTKLLGADSRVKVWPRSILLQEKNSLLKGWVVNCLLPPPQRKLAQEESLAGGVKGSLSKTALLVSVPSLGFG